MNRLFRALFFLTTAAGLALPFLPSGSWPWWDSVWILSFFVAVYTELAGSLGLGAARFSSGVVVITVAVLLGLSAFTGWPCGPIQFTAHVGLRIGDTVPLLLPLLAFALLTVSIQTATSAFPGANRSGLATASAGAFVLTILNGLAFFTRDRIWWIWNPLGRPDALWRGGFSLVFLAATIVLLCFVYPADPRMQRSRWSGWAVAWLFINALFLTANFAMFLR